MLTLPVIFQAMEMFLETITLAKEQIVGEKLPTVAGRNKGKQEVSQNHRKLLDVAWKVYDLTSEMAHLQMDVDNLASKVISLEKTSGKRNSEGKSSGKENSRENNSEGDNIEERNSGERNCVEKHHRENNSREMDSGKSELHPCAEKSEEHIFRDSHKIHDKYTRAKSLKKPKFLTFKEAMEDKLNGNVEADGKKASKGKQEGLSMDDLSFSIFKEIVGEVTADCVGKIMGMQQKEKAFALSGADASKTCNKWSEESEPMLHTGPTRTDNQVGAGIKLDNSKRELDSKPSYETMLRDFSLSKYAKPSNKAKIRRVRFRKSSSVDEDDEFFSTLNDSLYFHRSHIQSGSKLGPKISTPFARPRSSSIISSDGSDFL
eukprot:gene10581-19316_t